MNIHFDFHGSTYMADFNKKEEDKIEVILKDSSLDKRFGLLPFYVQNNSIQFNIVNKSHSDLYALNSSISKAISEQLRQTL